MPGVGVWSEVGVLIHPGWSDNFWNLTVHKSIPHRAGSIFMLIQTIVINALVFYEYHGQYAGGQNILLYFRV
jgi:hypothetical protein